MEMTGQRRLPASRDQVWQALNDPAILRASIPGCRTLEPAGENGFKATAAVKVGPISTVFGGDVRLLDLDPPHSYRIEGSGQGGAAGVARGGATVTLSEDGAATVLAYSVKAEVGGKLAQLGGRLIDATAKQMADQFFDNFVRVMAPAQPPVADADPVPAPAAPPKPAEVSMLAALPRDYLGVPVIGWIAAALFLFVAFNLVKPYLFGG